MTRLRTCNNRRKRKIPRKIGGLYSNGKLLGWVWKGLHATRKTPADRIIRGARTVTGTIRMKADDISTDSLRMAFGFDTAIEPDFSATGEMIGMSIVPKT